MTRTSPVFVVRICVVAAGHASVRALLGSSSSSEPAPPPPAPAPPPSTTEALPEATTRATIPAAPAARPPSLSPPPPLGRRASFAPPDRPARAEYPARLTAVGTASVPPGEPVALAALLPDDEDCAL